MTNTPVSTATASETHLAAAPAFTVRPGQQRGTTRLGWLHSRHSFSFGHYYDPGNLGYRALRVINDDVVAPGQGFGDHGHDNMEILTWVIEGSLRHGDSLGHDQLLRPGELQRMTAGTGIRHREFNGSAREKVHFLQIWIEPATLNAAPAYGQKAFDPAGRANRWQTLASGRADDVRTGAMSLAQDAVVRVADLAPAATLSVQNAPSRHAYLHVVTGSVRLGDVVLSGGDAVNVDEPGTLAFEAKEPSQVLWFDLA